MADSELRALQRDAEPGDVSARTKLIHERIRAGQLDAERLRLAAYLGDPASRLVRGEDPDHRPAWRRSRLGRWWSKSRAKTELFHWIRGLEPWGQEVCVRAALACARQVVGKGGRSSASAWASGETVLAVESWLADPSPEAEAELYDSLEGCPFLDHDHRGQMIVDEPADATVWNAAAAALPERFATTRDGVLSPATHASEGASHAIASLGEGLRQIEELERAIREALVPWALG